MKTIPDNKARQLAQFSVAHAKQTTRRLDMGNGESIHLLATGEETHGRCSILEITIAAGGGMSPHVHHQEDEHLFVLEGGFAARVGAREMSLGIGDHLYLPKGIPHSFRNTGTTMGRLLVTATPGGIDQMFREVSTVLSGPEAARGPEASAQISAIAARYNIDMPPLH